MKKKRKLISRRIEVLTDKGWVDRTGKKLTLGDSICIQREWSDGSKSSLFSCFRPKRPKNLSPVAYHKKYGIVPDNFTARHNGRYYCNPYHCHLSWKSKKERDEHLDGAYALLD